MQKRSSKPGGMLALLYIKYSVSDTYLYWNNMYPRKKTTWVDAFQAQTVAAQKHGPAPASLWAAVSRPQVWLHILPIPSHLGLMSLIKYSRASGSSIPQNHLELTVKSELDVFWPKSSLISNMDIVILIIRFFKFHDKRCNSWDWKCNMSVLWNESFDQSLKHCL